MPDFLFRPYAVVQLAEIVVLVVGLGYLVSVREKSTATWCLIGVMGGSALERGFSLVWSSLEGLVWGWGASAWGWLVLIRPLTGGVALWALVQFGYRFFEEPFPRESRLAAWATSLLLAAPLMGSVLSQVADSYGLSLLFAHAMSPVALLCIVWTGVVLLRKRARAQRGSDVAPRSARAYLAFAVLIGVWAVTQGLGVLWLYAGPSGGSLAYIQAFGSTAFVIGLVAVYLSHAPEPTTIQAKLIGLALVTTLSVLSIVGVLVIAETHRPTWTADLVPSPQTLRYEPAPSGGYTVDRVPYTPSRTTGDDLGLIDFGAEPIALGFSFPFGGTRWDTVNVDPNGTLAFGSLYEGEPMETPEIPFGVIPHIFVLLNDFNPARGGAVRVERAPGRATVVWDRVPDYQAGAPSTFGATLFESGAIEMTYDQVGTLTGTLRGLRHGRGIVPGPARLDPDVRVPTAASYPVAIAPGAAYVEDFSLTHLLRVQPLTRALLWLVLGATAFVIVAFLLVFRGTLIRPLRRLLDAVRRIDAGDLDVAVPVGTPDEFGRLSGGVNGMTASLRAHTETLEELVAERTAELEAARGRLVHAEKMASLGALTAGIAHEIKNPLNFVTNFAGLSRDAVTDLRQALADGDAEEVDAILDDLALNTEKIEAHGKRADGIVRGMMEHARGGAGERRAVELNALVGEHAGLAHHAHRARRSDAEADVALDLDPEAGTVEMVPEEIGRVVVNLVSNALDAVAARAASENGAYAPTVTVSTRRLGDGVEVRVTDNGPGVPEADRARVFEPFFTTKPTGEGTGLGLSLAHDIVAQGHGGTLAIGETEGEGTVFVVSLPHSSDGS